MLKGKELGNAIKTAIELKIASGAITSKADVASYFGIKTPSIYDWIKKGSISKDKLIKLWSYFSDVVGPAHWGLDDGAYKSALDAAKHKVSDSKPLVYITNSQGMVLSDEEVLLIKAYRKKSRELQVAILKSLDVKPIDFAKSA